MNLPPPEPTDPARWFAFAAERVAHFENQGGHYGKAMAANWRQEIENAKLPHYFNRIRIEP